MTTDNQSWKLLSTAPHPTRRGLVVTVWLCDAPHTFVGAAEGYTNAWSWQPSWEVQQAMDAVFERPDPTTDEALRRLAHAADDCMQALSVLAPKLAYSSLGTLHSSEVALAGSAGGSVQLEVTGRALVREYDLGDGPAMERHGVVADLGPALVSLVKAALARKTFHDAAGWLSAQGCDVTWNER